MPSSAQAVANVHGDVEHRLTHEHQLADRDGGGAVDEHDALLERRSARLEAPAEQNVQKQCRIRHWITVEHRHVANSRASRRATKRTRAAIESGAGDNPRAVRAREVS